MFNLLLQKLAEFTQNPYLRQREVDLTLFVQNNEQQTKMSSRYIPLLPKDLCQIPLRPIDADSLANMNKRSRSKGRFPFHLPHFLNKRLFPGKSTSTQSGKNRNRRSSLPFVSPLTLSFQDPNCSPRTSRAWTTTSSAARLRTLPSRDKTGSECDDSRPPTPFHWWNFTMRYRNRPRSARTRNNTRRHCRLVYFSERANNTQMYQ